MSLATTPGTMLHKSMKRLPEKILKILESLDTPQSKAARAIEVDASQFSKWTKGQGKPTVEQLLALSKFLNTSMEFLVDDTLDQPIKGNELTDDEKMVIRIFHTSGLTAEEAVERLLIKKLGMHPRK